MLMPPPRSLNNLLAAAAVLRGVGMKQWWGFGFFFPQKGEARGLFTLTQFIINPVKNFSAGDLMVIG